MSFTANSTGSCAARLARLLFVLGTAVCCIATGVERVVTVFRTATLTGANGGIEKGCLMFFHCVLRFEIKVNVAAVGSSLPSGRENCFIVIRMKLIYK